MASEPALPTVFDLVHLAHGDDAGAEAARRARQGAREGTLVWIEHPDAPRARLGRAWRTGVDSNAGLHLALVLRPDLPAADCAQLAPVAIVAIGRAIADVVEPMTELHYRWPNDVLLDGGKVSGVWLEAGGDGERLDWLVLQCAVNTGTIPEGLGFEAAGLVEDGAAGDVDTRALLQSLARHLLAGIESWDEHGFGRVARSWRGRLLTSGTTRIVLGTGEELEGGIESVEDDGTLVLRRARDRVRVTLAQFFGLPGSGGSR